MPSPADTMAQLDAMLRDSKQKVHYIVHMRQMNLKKVLRWWQQGNDGQTLNTLLSLRDDSITKDFLQMTCTDSCRSDLKINLDTAKALLDLSMPLVKSTHQEYNLIGLSSQCYIFNQLFDRILGLKNKNSMMTRN